jgi:uncharacterized protein YndB with AHSA1/START domain
MQDATLATGSGRPVIRLERRLSRSPSEVWRALTEREELNAWFPCDVLTETWKVGASLRFVFRGGEWHDLEGTVLECDEPRTLSFTWGDETLRFELTADDGGTQMVFTNELDAPSAARNSAGWIICLEHLEGRATEEDLWKDLFDRHVAAFVPALGPQEGPPTRP